MSRPGGHFSEPPGVETLREIARFRGLDLTDAQLQAACSAYAAFWPKLERLRAVHLSYAPPTVTPADAIGWIAAGGRHVE